MGTVVNYFEYREQLANRKKKEEGENGDRSNRQKAKERNERRIANERVIASLGLRKPGRGGNNSGGSSAPAN